MPEWVGILIFLGVTLVIWYFVWKMHQIEERRKKEKEQMEHELKIKLHKPTIKANLKLEKARMKHEFKMNRHRPTIRTLFKREKAQMYHEQKMNGIETTPDKIIKTIPETIKNTGNLIKEIKTPIKLRIGKHENEN